MTEERIKRLAEKITDYLFTNGAGKKARRLVLELEDGQDGGGWSKRAVEQAILKMLMEGEHDLK